MTIQDLGSLGELVAALATIVTLAYLALQIRGANQATLLSTVQHSYDSLNGFCDTILQSSELASIVLRGRKAYTDLDEIERIRFGHLHLRILNTIESWHFQVLEAASGGYQDDKLADIAASLRVYFDHPGVGQWWETNEVRFDEALVELLEANTSWSARQSSA